MLKTKQNKKQFRPNKTHPQVLFERLAKKSHIILYPKTKDSQILETGIQPTP